MAPRPVLSLIQINRLSLEATPMLVQRLLFQPPEPAHAITGID